MSYPIGTILGRIEPLPDVTEDVPGQYDEDGEQVTATKTHPLNKLRIVAPSPLNKASVESWQGAGDNEFVVVTPADEFGPNENAPVGALNQEYEVLEYGEEEADKTIELESPAHRRERLRSPEQVFQAETVQERKRAKAAGEEEKPRLFGAALAAKQKKEAAQAAE